MNQEKITELENVIDKDYSNIAGMVVLKNGETLYEKYFNGCTADCRIHVYSVTKSILSVLIGIAIDRGYIKSVSQKVLDFFPDYTVKKGEKTIQDITLEHLLTMTAPYKYKSAPYIKYFTSDNFVKFTLDLLGGRGQIGDFRYTPLIGPDILSGILANSTGRSVLDLASENLFSPLGITVARSLTFQSKEEQMAFNTSTDLSGWASDPAGNHTGGWGLSLSPVDMAKIGQLYLNGGVWNGKTDRLKKLDRGEHKRTQPMGKVQSSLWIFMVVIRGYGAGIFCHGRWGKCYLCEYTQGDGGFHCFSFCEEC